MTHDRVRTVLRWLATTVVVALMVWGMIRLSQWQWHKHVARDAELHRIAANREDGVVPLASVVPATGTVGQSTEWRLVRVTGTWQPAETIVARLRTVSGANGFEILTPVRGVDGTAVLVDRGLLGQGSNNRRPDLVPAVRAGQVTVSGYLRRSEVGGSAPVDGVVRRLDVPAIAATMPFPVLDGYLQLVSATPVDSTTFVLLPPPSQDPGPYLSYSVQWVIFALIAVGGLGFLAVDEIRGGRLRERLRPPAPAGTTVAGAAPPTPPGPAAPDVPGPPVPAGARVASAAADAAAPVPAGPGSRRRAVQVLAGAPALRPELPASFFEDDLDHEPDPAPTDGGPGAAATPGAGAPQSDRVDAVSPGRRRGRGTNRR